MADSNRSNKSISNVTIHIGDRNFANETMPSPSGAIPLVHLLPQISIQPLPQVERRWRSFIPRDRTSGNPRDRTSGNNTLSEDNQQENCVSSRTLVHSILEEALSMSSTNDEHFDTGGDVTETAFVMAGRSAATSNSKDKTNSWLEKQ